MSILADSLLPKDIRLAVRSSDQHGALEEMLSRLRGDDRVRDWEKLRGSLLDASLLESSLNHFRGVPGTMFLHHGRTESVSSLLLCAARSPAGIVMPGHPDKIHLLFLAAIPTALDNEYLRILGAIARVCRDSDLHGQLLQAADESSFLAILERGCLQ